ncbi:hypothetical protein ABFY09_00590 [Marinomonas sp. 5E14-1]|uniref:hypothetical protein n=1 Tax=Marinomonas sp. 5E14-1 TaxID=3153922 RepID=UPI003266EBEF
MKALTPILLSLSLLSTPLFSDGGDINPDTARAYQGYMLSFLWPEGQSSEHIDYKNVFTVDNLIRLPKESISVTHNKASASFESTPFDNMEQKLNRRVTILANKKWTLIFKAPGDTIKKQFTSKQVKDGYPELTGYIAIKLGRYLESDIHYKHYLFDSFTQPEIDLEATNNNESNLFSQETDNTNSGVKAFEPALVLQLHLSNRTASKKVNYLDHPAIGTLLYFQPIELEDAMATIALETMPLETGASLDYDELQSTNELFESSPKVDPPFIPQ